MRTHLKFKKNRFMAVLTVAVSAMVALPVLLLPVGISDGAPAYILVNKAYAATYPYDPNKKEVLVESYANKNLANLIPQASGSSTTSPEKGATATPTPATEKDNAGLPELGAGQTLKGTDEKDSTTPDQQEANYADIPTITVTGYKDEDNIPVEIVDPSVFMSDDTLLYVQTDDTIIKEKPIMDSVTVGSINKGASVQRIGIGDSWSKIRTEDGVEGYVPTYCLSYEMIFIEIDRTVWTTTWDLKLRSEPSTASDVLGVLDEGTRLSCTAVSDKWYKVKTDKGTVGYVYISYTSTTPPATPTPTPTPKPAAPQSSSTATLGQSTGNTSSLPVITGVNGQSIVSVCESLLGVPYVWAGESRSGVDCSGLAVYAYRQVTGMSLPHQTNSLLSSGIGVGYADLALGDILLWDTDGNMSTSEHAGIYVGGGQVIHASSRLQQVVYGDVNMMPIVSIRRIIQ